MLHHVKSCPGTCSYSSEGSLTLNIDVVYFEVMCVLFCIRGHPESLSNIPYFDWLLCLWFGSISCEFIQTLVTSRLHHHLRFDIIFQFLLFSVSDIQRGSRVTDPELSLHYSVPLICISALVFGNISTQFFATLFFIAKTESLTCAGKDEFPPL